jgi:hypothetical protein
VATSSTKRGDGRAHRADLRRAPTKTSRRATGRRTDKLLREVDDGTSVPSKTRDTIATAAELMFEHDGLSNWEVGPRCHVPFGHGNGGCFRLP